MAVNPIPTIHMVKRIERNGNISLYTCEHTWEPEHYNKKGQLVKGRSRATNHKKVGNVLNPVNNSGWVQFYDFVYKDYPELKDYLVYRQDSKTLYFHKSEVFIDAHGQPVLPGIPDGVSLPEEFTNFTKPTPSNSNDNLNSDVADAFLAIVKDHELSLAKDASKFRVATTKHAGASHLISHLARQTMLKAALDKALGNKKANKILSIVTRIIIENEFKLKGMSEFLKHNDVVSDNDALENSFSLAVNSLSKEHMNAFFTEFIQLQKDNNLIASTNDKYIIHLANGTPDQQASLQVLCDQEGKALYYVLAKGYDESMVHSTLLGELEPLICGNTVHEGNSLVDTLIKAQQSFIVNCSTLASYGKTATEIALANDIKKMSNMVFDHKLRRFFCYQKVDLPYDYGQEVSNIKANDSGSTLACHVFYSPVTAGEVENLALHQIAQAIIKLQQGKTIDSSEKQILKLFTNYDETIHVLGSDECETLHIDGNKFEVQKQNWGIEVLLSNETNMSYHDVYKNYHSRAPIENSNQILKALLKTKSDNALENQAFLVFLATIITSYINAVINKNRATSKSIISCNIDSVADLLRVVNQVMVDVYDRRSFKGKCYHEISAEVNELFSLFGLHINKDYIVVAPKP